MRTSLFRIAVVLAAASLLLPSCKEEKPAAPANPEPTAAAQPAAATAETAPAVAVNAQPAAAPAVPPAPTPAVAPAAAATATAAPGAAHPAMQNPALATETAPDEFKVKFDTTKGSFTIAVHKKWSPAGADRFYNLVKIGYFRDVAFFRAIAGFMCQFGIHGDPAVNRVWREASIQDDPPAGQSNRRYTITFAKKGLPNSRSVQFFINFKDNMMLDQMGFTPFGEVVDGQAVVDQINTEYGEGAPGGRGPDQMRVQTEGNAYLKASFPRLDYVTSVTLL